MHKIINRLKQFTYEYGMGRMTKEFRKFAYMHFAFNAAMSLTGIFVSAFLFNVSGKMSTIAIYYLFFYLFEMTGEYLVVRFAHRISNIAFTATGLVLHALAYGMLLITRENAIHIYPLIASVCGLGSGFYWVNYYSLFQNYTHIKDRQYGMAFIAMVLNIMVLVAPILSGSILSRLVGNTGYTVIFSIALVFFAVSVVFSLRLRDTAQMGERRYLWKVIKSMWDKKVLNQNIAAEFIGGVKGGVYAFYLSTLIFSMTSNELVLGMSDTLRGAVAILLYYILGRYNFGPKGRMRLLIGALILGVAITGSLFFWYGTAAVIIYYVLNNASDVLSSNFKTYVGYEIAELTTHTVGKDMSMETAAVRLIALELGRICGIGISFLVPGENTIGILAFFLALTIANLCTGFIYKRAAKLCAKEHEIC